MRKKLKNIAFRILHPIFKWYTASPREYSYRGISVVVYPGVFFPKWILSTEFLLEYLESEDLSNKSLLELGAGNGIISFRSAQRGAKVTASDVSRAVLKGLQSNQKQLDLPLEIIESDVFESIPQKEFDYIIVNPPYYARNPSNEAEMAWYCGSGFEYFKSFFGGLAPYRNEGSQVLMILSEDCDLNSIEEIAKYCHWEMQKIKIWKKWGEENFLFSIVQSKQPENKTHYYEHAGRV